MEPLLPEHVTQDVHRLVDVLRTRLGLHELVAAAGWEAFAGACGVRSRESQLGATPLVVGPVETVLVAIGDPGFGGDAVGFVMPAAQKPAPWKRAPIRYMDPTRTLWQYGWSPIAVERVDVPTAAGAVEIVIGRARPTPDSLTTCVDRHCSA